MKTIVELRLNGTKEELATLERTMEAANQACNAMSEWAWANRKFSPNAIQKATYPAARAAGLSAQFAERCIARVVDAYQRDGTQPVTFEPHGPVIYSDTFLRFDLAKGRAHLMAIGGRLKLPFDCSPREYQMLSTWHGDCELILRGSDFYLLVPCHPDTSPR